jgi:hypothetical protein
MNDWFTHCQSLEEARNEYHRLCFEHHPDHGGDTTVMQAINTAYERFKRHWTARPTATATTASFRRKRSARTWVRPTPTTHTHHTPIREPHRRDYLRNIWNRHSWHTSHNGSLQRTIWGHTIMLFQHPSPRYKDGWFVLFDNRLSPYMFETRAEAEREAFNLVYEQVKYRDL